MTKSFTKFRSRILFLSSIVIIIWAGLTVRFFHIQVIKSNDLADRSKRQGDNKVELSAVRGSVKDRNNNDLASNVVHYSFGIHPKEVENRERLVKAFVEATGRQRNYYEERLDSQASFVFLDRNLRYNIAQPLLRIEDKGLISNRHGYRYYPQKRIASQVLGFTDVDNVGIEGIEKQFNKHLKGKSGWIVLQKDGKGRSRRNNSYPRMAPVDGSDLHLTIDLHYQAILQNELQKQVKKTSAKGAMGVIVEPSTGKILAISSLPDFDPNEAATFPPETFRNRVVTDQFEPGSTFKLVSATAALSRKLVRTNEEINCGNGFYEYRGQMIEDWDKFGLLTFPQIIQNSSNVGIVKVSERVGPKNLYDFGRKFGFGALSGIAFPGEAKGVMKRTEEWSRISIAEISIGYEVSVTSLQLALAYSAVANGGFLMKPHIVEKIIHPTGTISYQAEPQV
ncbi:MAG: peptidoglycan D,D-transpeptidase FtsI family protein, partial [Candidatus Neomarinimicrobiota bacterium]